MIRQLNFYNFKKVSKERVTWVYRHELFHRDHPEMMDNLKRKTNSSIGSPNGPRQHLSSIGSEDSLGLSLSPEDYDDRSDDADSDQMDMDTPQDEDKLWWEVSAEWDEYQLHCQHSLDYLSRLLHQLDDAQVTSNIQLVLFCCSVNPSSTPSMVMESFLSLLNQCSLLSHEFIMYRQALDPRKDRSLSDLANFRSLSWQQSVSLTRECVSFNNMVVQHWIENQRLVVSNEEELRVLEDVNRGLQFWVRQSRLFT